MKRALTFALAFSCLVLWLGRSSFAQDQVTQTPVSVAAESGTRELDKLNGPVRRVRVETARIIPKNGNWVEGPREVLGIATYDPTGRKIDSVAYPGERNALSGKEQYVYDNKGNVVEMTLRSTDGSMLSKESYQYEFDQLGNWTKMSSSVAVYENGKIIFEPTGITYRTISYYYSQAIEKLSAASPKSKEVPAPSTPSTPLPNSSAPSTVSSRPPTPVAQVNATVQPLSENARAHATTEPVTAPASVSPARNSTAVPERPNATLNEIRATPDNAPANAHATTEPVTAPASVSPAKNGTAAPESPNATSSEIRATPDNAPATNVVRYVLEEELRRAAIELPKPEYSDAALKAQASGKVGVQIVVDEAGRVTTAQAISGHPLLAASAEAAARKARFSFASASSGANRVYGVISYDFEPPTLASEVSAATTPKMERTPPQPDDRKPEVRMIRETPALIESKPKAPDYAEVARSSYNKGVTLQAAGRYAEAAEAFDQTIKVNPNDAKAYARLGMAYSAMEKHKDAIVVYKMATQIDVSVLGAPAYYMWGHSYLALQKSSEALSAFKRALNIVRAAAIDPEQKQPQRYPSLEQLHYGLAIAYLNSKRFGDSISELKQVVRLNPKNAEAHYNLAIAYLSNGSRREAEVHQRTLSSLNPALAERLTRAISGGGTLPGCLNIACRR